ncbi:MAG: alpha-N-arabinofuranosidase [Acidobacteriota bacterium]
MKRSSRRTFLKKSAGAVVAGGALLHPDALSVTTASAAVPAPAGPLEATIDVRKVGEPITKYMYGMFLEQLADLVYRSLWSEMLDDRKFYFPVNSAPEKKMGPRFRRMRLRKWRPVGGDQFVVMDKDNPYVGEHSPRITLGGATARGIQQSGLALQKGKVYTGRAILAGTPGAKVKVSLVWGTGAGDRQTVTVSHLRSDYAKFPLKFTAQTNTEDGRLEILGTGQGSFHIGTVSLMPTDNIDGWRPDTTRLLRELNSGFYRLPGGNFISDHNWRDAIGRDRDKRAPTWDYAWHFMQPNDVGMDEFMTLCKLLNVEPYVTVNAGLGEADSAAALVEYTNGSVHTRLGARRAANGHPEPYHVKFWDIGNEMYGFWQIGHTYLRYYVLKHNAFAKAMRKVDPSITLVACGAMPDEMTVTGNALLTTGQSQAKYGSEADWTGGMLAKCWGNFDGIAEHWYCRSGMRYDLNVGNRDPFPLGSTTTLPSNYGYVPVKESLVDWARRPSNRVRLKSEAWHEYQKRFPAMKDKKVFLAIDEWAYTGTRPNLKLALCYALVFHEMFRHTDFLKMSAFTFGISCLDFNSTEAIYNSTGQLFKFYREHFGTLPVEVTGNSPQPAPKWPVGGDQPKVNAGSPTYPLDVSAALTSDRKFLTVAIVNPTESAHKIALNIEGVKVGGKPSVWQMTGASLDAADVLGQKPQIEIRENQIREAVSALTIAPIRINIYAFELVGMA